MTTKTPEDNSVSTIDLSAELWHCTNAEYHAESEHVSNSKAKVYMENPLDYDELYVSRTRDPDPPTDDMIFGQLFHSFCLEEEVNWIVWNGGDRRTKEGKAAWGRFQIESFGKHVIEQKDEDALLGMRESLNANSEAVEAFSADGNRETSCKWIHPSGLKCKTRWDFLAHSGSQLDIKVVGDSSEDFFERRVSSFYYDCQDAFYTMGSESLSGATWPRFRFVVVCKKPPYRCYVYELENDVRVVARDYVNAALYRMVESIETGVFRDPRANKTTRIGLKPWHFAQRGFR